MRGGELASQQWLVVVVASALPNPTLPQSMAVCISTTPTLSLLIPSSAFASRRCTVQCRPRARSPPSGDADPGHGGGKRISKQSSWEAKDSEGKDYLYRLGKEADNLSVTVGARHGVIDDLFVGNFLGKDCMFVLVFFFVFFFWLENQFCLVDCKDAIFI